ncbi:hypothetical protein E2C01_093654 [Portunus trituberculatus]|uniref:Uncharacterized protein n=1 Tax=Portunus trituberculatus TaxID=210409 RepID=A0A5B7JN99_PORTR|nr:hypothetical protein [Portunus trituberculatus]
MKWCVQRPYIDLSKIFIETDREEGQYEPSVTLVLYLTAR